MNKALYTDTKIQEQMVELPSEITSLVTNGGLEAAIFCAQDEFDLTDAQTGLLETEVILVLLLLLDNEGFTARIIESLEISAPKAEDLTALIQVSIFNEAKAIFEQVYTQTNEKKHSPTVPNSLIGLQETFPPQTIPTREPVKATDTKTSSELAVTPQSTPPEVQPMRTMRGDMNHIHGYGAYRAQFPDESGGVEYTEEVIRSASQDDLLAEKPKLADMPSYENKG